MKILKIERKRQNCCNRKAYKIVIFLENEFRNSLKEENIPVAARRHVLFYFHFRKFLFKPPLVKKMRSTFAFAAQCSGSSNEMRA